MKRIVFVVVWWGICGLLLEAGLQFHYRLTVGQWLFARTALPLFEADPVSGFRLKPLQSLSHRTPEFRTRIFTNADGFRVSSAGEAVGPGKTDGVPRVLLLGPSFAFGWGVDHEDTFLQRLRHYWAAEPGAAVPEVINAGVPALGPVQQLAWYRAVGRELDPDLVIQFVYGSPEVSAEYSESMTVSEKGYLVPRDATWRRHLINDLKRSGVVFYSWSVATRLASRPRGGPEARGGLTARGGVAGPDGVQPTGKSIAGGGRVLTERTESFDPESAVVRQTAAFYDDFLAAMEETGAQGLVVFLPLAYRVHPEDLPRWRHRGVAHPEEGLEYDRALLGWLRGGGVPLLDLTEDLRGAAVDGTRLYYLVDIHWTPAGHDVAAQSAWSRLKETPIGGW